MTWKVGLVGDPSDFEVLRDVAPLFGYCIEGGDNGRGWLAGTELGASAESARQKTAQVMDQLNGFARLHDASHRAVQGSTSAMRTHSDGRSDVALSAEIRVRASIGIVVFRADGIVERPSTIHRHHRARKIEGNPQLEEVVSALGGTISWQRLRVAFEKITAMIGKGPKDVSALVNQGYASNLEITDFKKNVEDPRHSGLDAVHGVASGPLQGNKMSLKAGLKL